MLFLTKHDNEEDRIRRLTRLAQAFAIATVSPRVVAIGDHEGGLFVYYSGKPMERRWCDMRDTAWSWRYAWEKMNEPGENVKFVCTGDWEPSLVKPSPFDP